MTYARIAVKPGVAVCAIQAKEGEGKEQAIRGLIIDSFLLQWKHREFGQIP